MTGIGAAIFILGSATNAFAVGTAAAGNLPSSASSFSWGFAFELAACVILAIGLRMKGGQSAVSLEREPQKRAEQPADYGPLFDLESPETPIERRNPEATDQKGSA